MLLFGAMPQRGPFVWPCHSEAFLDFSLQHNRPAQLHRALRVNSRLIPLDY